MAVKTKTNRILFSTVQPCVPYYRNSATATQISPHTDRHQDKCDMNSAERRHDRCKYFSVTPDGQTKATKLQTVS